MKPLPWKLAPLVFSLAIPCVPTPASAQSVTPDSLSVGFRKASKRVIPAVVTVRAAAVEVIERHKRIPGVPDFVPIPEVTRRYLDQVLPPEQPEVIPDENAGAGSGVIIDAAKGFVLTNDHLVAGASTVSVVLNNGRERVASQIRHDPRSDLALLVIDPRGLSETAWGDSDALETGDWVVAVGQPLGLAETVSAGIVSGRGRAVGASVFEDLIRTDAAINSGNSGGPLVNLKGEVVGIGTVIKTRPGRDEGVGFAVPAARARRVAADLAQFGAVRRAFVGVSIAPVDPAVAERLERPGAVGIGDVAPGSPAEQAGLRRGDVVLSVRGKPVNGVGGLQGGIEFATAGEPLPMILDRNGQVVEIQVVPQADALRQPTPDAPRALGVVGGVMPRPAGRPDPAPLIAPGVPTPLQDFPALGIRLSTPDAKLVRMYRLAENASGLVVVGVDPDGPADRSGVEIGMVIVAADDRKVGTLDEFSKAIADRPAGKDLLLRVLRGTKAESRVIVDPAHAERP